MTTTIQGAHAPVMTTTIQGAHAPVMTIQGAQAPDTPPRAHARGVPITKDHHL
jgi:hypothetical protein